MSAILINLNLILDLLSYMITLKGIKYDKELQNQMVFGIGFNTTIIEGESLNDSPYKLGGSLY